MNMFNLNQLLRYGFGGMFYFVALFISFDVEPDLFFTKSLDNVFIASGFLFLIIGVGSLIYSIHRAIGTYITHKFCLIYCNIDSSMHQQSIDSWVNKLKKNNIQVNMIEWADQCHFLYCTSWAIFAALLLGYCSNFHQRQYSLLVFFVGIFVLVIAIINDCLYINCEKIVFEHDEDLPYLNP